MNQNKTNDNRYLYIDYAKGVGILIIILSHCMQFFEPMWEPNGYIKSFHVPVFFIASGCLAFYQKDKCIPIGMFLKKRGKTLLIPYLIFSMINFVIRIGILFLKHTLIPKEVLETLKAFLITGNGTVWFLVALFGIEMIFWLIKRLGIIRYNVMIAGIGLICFIMPYQINDFLQNAFGTVFIRIIAGMGYYLAGFLLAQGYAKLQRRVVFAAGFVLIALGSVSYAIFGSAFSFASGDFLELAPSLSASLCIGIGIISLLYGCEQKPEVFRGMKVIHYYGINSLIVMVVHPIFIQCFLSPFKRPLLFNFPGISGVILTIVLFLAISVLQVPCIRLINNKMPWVIGKHKR